MRAFVTVLLFSTLAASNAATTSDPSGLWSNDQSMLRITLQEGSLRAEVVDLVDPTYGEGESDRWPAGEARRDENNPDVSLQERLIVGINLLQEFELRDGKWQGKLYDPETGKTYSANITVSRRGNLRMRGYIGTPLLGRTVEFVPAERCDADTRKMVAGAALAGC